MSQGRPIVMKFSRGEDYKTTIVISDYDTLTYHATELPKDVKPEQVARFFIEAEHAASKQFEKMVDDSAASNWTETDPEMNRYTGG